MTFLRLPSPEPLRTVRSRQIQCWIDEILDDVERPMEDAEIASMCRNHPPVAQILEALRYMHENKLIARVEVEITKHLIGGRTITVTVKAWRQQE